jgi:uncharacterized protein (DUF885 family)
MTRFSHGVLLGLAVFALIGCGRAPQPAQPKATKAAAPPEQLSRIVELYWAERIDTEDAISPQLLADSLNIERHYLIEVLGVSRDGLDAESQLSYDIFRRQRELAIEGFTFPTELLPINPFRGMPLKLAVAAADAGQYPLTSAAEFDSWLRRIDEYVSWTQQATANMREGVRRGYTSPRALVERMLRMLERLDADGPGNVFYTPLHSMPAAIKEPQRSQLTKTFSAAISEKLLPANRALHEFLRNEYLPRARAGLALSDLPLGAEWYAYRVKRATSTNLSADEIHRIGIAEVERLRARTPPLRDAGAAPAPGVATQAAGGPGSTGPGTAGPAAARQAPAPLAADELLQAYKELAVKVRAAVPALFAEVPTGDFDIRATTWISEPASPLYYQPPGPAGNQPAVLYVDIGAAARAVSTSSFLTQAVPGRYYQIAIQQENAELPRFRRFGAEAAFSDGWGLYSALQGEQLGLYSDEAEKLDAAAGEMRCAVALVVDTGLHAKAWTPTQALDYLRAHLAVDDVDAHALIDWYAANPADALACKMGEMRFQALRTRAQQLLAGRFDIRGFHSEILKNGAMPLDILEAKMNAWMDGLK